MNLTYEIKHNGYEIYNEGKLWITQYEPYIPRPNLSYEENAKLHIEELLESTSEKKNMETRISDLEQEIANLNYTLMMGGMI